MLVKLCPPVTEAAAEFHAKMPNIDIAVSNQYVPAAGFAVGADDDAASASKSIAALVTYALLLTPNTL